MSKITTAIKLLKSNKSKLGSAIFLNMMDLKFMRLLNDRIYLRFAYFCCTGKRLNLNNPKEYCEKLQWLKLYDRKAIYITMVDKYKVKKYVADKIGEKYIIPTIGVWQRPEDIDFESLPDKFVLKWNHDSGSIVICRDKKTFDRKSALKKLHRGNVKNGFWYGREWPYKNVVPYIIAEELLEDTQKTDLSDYKFFCFDGEPQYCQVIRERSIKETIDFYDMQWNHQEFVGLNPGVRNGMVPVECPPNLDEMIKICRKLSANMPFSRIDLYSVNGKCYFGEITLYPASGFGTFEPKKWNTIFGNMIRLK